jgi:hypothetical protein
MARTMRFARLTASYETLRFCGEIFSGGYRETVFSHQAAKVAKKVGASISWRPWRLGGLAAWRALSFFSVN